MDFDAYTATDWPQNYVLFLNPPYTQAAAAIFKALIEFMKGCNIVLLVLSESVDGERI